MIIAGDDELVLGNQGENKKFSITTSAKAFKILSSGLYKNKIRAVVRELACNCLDAHKLNGFEGKFDIQVPGQLDPRFIIRDYGPGLSKDQLENMYTTYFASTKNGSNDFIGALGLGSKSPFSYTETFTVVSYHNGMAYGYTAMLDKGEPVIRPIFEEAMKDDEKTGLEITVPVKTDDINRWKQEISYVVRPFGESRVNLVGSALNPDWFDDFDEVFYKDDIPYGYAESRGIYAVYGSIVYPLNDVPGLNATWMRTRHDVVYVKFPLGELDIAASREELSLDETTIQNIIKRVSDLDARIMEEDIKEFQNCTNERQVLRDLLALNYNARAIVENKGVKFTPNKLSFKQLSAKYDTKNTLINAGVVYTVEYEPRLKRIKTSTSNSSVASVNSMFGIAAKKLNVVIDDEKGRLPAMRALYSMHADVTPETEAAKKIIKDNPMLPNLRENVLFINPESEVEMDLLPTLLELFGDDTINIMYTSELNALVKDFIPKKEAGPGAPRPKAHSAMKYKLKDDKWISEELFLPASEADEISGAVVFVHGYNYMFMEDKFGCVSNITASSITYMAEVMGLTEVTFVRPTLHKKVIKFGQCYDLLATIVEKFVELIDEVDYDYYSATSGRAYNYSRHTNQYPQLHMIVKHLSERGESTPESLMLNAFRSSLQQASVFAYKDSTYNDYVKTGSNICYKLSRFAEERAAEKIKKFEADNILVSYYLRANYSLNENEINEIVKLMGE